MSRSLKLAILATSAVGLLALGRPALADGKAIPGYRPPATKAAPAAKKGSVAVVRPAPVRPAPKKRFAPYKTYGFRTGPTVKYNHHHPIPSGGWCRMGGWHVHTYAPVVNPHWVLEGAGYVYLGIVPEVAVVAPRPPVVYVETAPPPPPVVYVTPAPAPAPTVIYLDGPDCRETIKYKKDGVRVEYKCKHHGKKKGHGKHKKHAKHHDHDD